MTERAEIFTGWFIPDSETILPYGLRDSKGVVESYNACIRINEVFLLYYNNKRTRGSPSRYISFPPRGRKAPSSRPLFMTFPTRGGGFCR